VTTEEENARAENILLRACKTALSDERMSQQKELAERPNKQDLSTVTSENAPCSPAGLE
jgi:hypothetical protein